MSFEIQSFFSGPEAKLLKEKEFLEWITKTIPVDSAEFYDLTFHAAFAKRIFDILKREGNATQGADRMQQSFRESVEKVKSILAPYEALNHPPLSASSTPEAQLARKIEDLALLKNWIMKHGTGD